MLIAEIQFRQVNTPDDLWCECGHVAPKLFKREGPDSEAQPIRFWKISGNGHNKIICEPCLVIINYAARIKKQQRDNNG